MVWTKKAKLDFYWARRRKAIEAYTEAAKLLGTSTKRAKTKALKDIKREYKKRKENYKAINQFEKQIKKLQSKERNKIQDKKLDKLIKQQAKLLTKTTKQWNLFENKIKYQTKGAQDEETITKAKT